MNYLVFEEVEHMVYRRAHGTAAVVEICFKTRCARVNLPAEELQLPDIPAIPCKKLFDHRHRFHGEYGHDEPSQLSYPPHQREWVKLHQANVDEHRIILTGCSCLRCWRRAFQQRAYGVSLAFSLLTTGSEVPVRHSSLVVGDCASKHTFQHLPRLLQSHGRHSQRIAVCLLRRS